jgi:hypothetical protein
MKLKRNQRKQKLEIIKIWKLTRKSKKTWVASQEALVLSH